MSRLRVAIMTSPRTGSTWLRRILAQLYDLAEDATAATEHMPWDELPERLVVHRHDYPHDELRAILDRAGFRPIFTIARHPLDSLISHLHFLQDATVIADHRAGESSTPYPDDSEAQSSFSQHVLDFMAREGHEPRVYDVSRLTDATPASEAFLDYATSTNAFFALSVSRLWWETEGVVRVRYEDLVANPETQVGRLVEAVGEPPRHPIAEVVGANSLGSLRNSAVADHYWQGRPGLWKSLLTASGARRIAEAHRPAFDLFGYECDGDDALTRDRAELNWYKLEAAAARSHVARLQGQLRSHHQAQPNAAELPTPTAMRMAAMIDGLARRVPRLRKFAGNHVRRRRGG